MSTSLYLLVTEHAELNAVTMYRRDDTSTDGTSVRQYKLSSLYHAPNGSCHCHYNCLNIAQIIFSPLRRSYARNELLNSSAIANQQTSEPGLMSPDSSSHCLAVSKTDQFAPTLRRS